MHNGTKQNNIEFFQAGFCYHPEVMVNTKAPWKKAVFPAMVALIHHSQWGYVLFDTGYSERFYQATQKLPHKFYRWITPVTIPAEQTIVNQLKNKGISASEIKVVFISHFHADHIAGLKDFPQAKFICSQQAYHHMRSKKGLSAVMNGYLKDLLPDDFESRALFIEELIKHESDDVLTRFESCFQLSDDGQLLAVSLPGHARGHYGLLIKHEKRWSFLVGDACWTHHAYTGNCKPHKVTSLVMDKMSTYHKTVDHLRTIHQQHEKIDIILSHCQHTLASLVP